MSTKPIFEQLVDRAGGLTALKHALGENSLNTVSNWRTRGIPANRAVRIERLFGIPVHRTRPDDWAEYWPDAKRRKKSQ